MKHQFIQACSVESSATGAILLVEMWNCHIRPCGSHHHKAYGTCCVEKCTLFHLALFTQLSHTQSPVITNPQLSTLRSMINVAITFLCLKAAEPGNAAKKKHISPTVRFVLNHVDYLMALLKLSYIFIWLKYSLADLLNRFCVWSRHTSIHYLILGRQHGFETGCIGLKMVTLMLLLSWWEITTSLGPSHYREKAFM